MVKSLLILTFLSVSLLKAQNNAIAAATPEATQAGAAIFALGGNAADAAVAIAFTLGVTEPAMSGIGGRTMLLLSQPNKEPVAIGGISMTPYFVQEDITKEKLTYYKQVTIPSQVKILEYVWKNYGSGKVTWAQVLAPAISFAEEGFVVGLHRHQVFSRYAKKLQESPYHNGEVLIDGGIPAIGETVKQPTLGKTLRRLANKGANDFYKGEIAQEIAKDMTKNAGWTGLKDLENLPDPIEIKPLHTTYRGYDIYSFPPPGGGWQILQILNLMEKYPVEKLSKHNITRQKIILKILNMSHQDRLDFPIQDYVNYHTEVSKKIDKKYRIRNPLDRKTNGKKGVDTETSHFSVIDKSGMGLSVTSSLGAYYGAQAATKSLGFFYNSYAKSLVNFGLKGKGLSPNTKVPSSMSPSLVKKNGKNVLLIGTPGSKRIVSTTSQLIQLWIDSKLSIREIIKLPRLHAIKNQAYVENLTHSGTLIPELRAMGFEIVFPNYDLTIGKYNAYFGGVHAIEFKNDRWQPAADPRRDGEIYQGN